MHGRTEQRITLVNGVNEEGESLDEHLQAVSKDQINAEDLRQKENETKRVSGEKGPEESGKVSTER